MKVYKKFTPPLVAKIELHRWFIVWYSQPYIPNWFMASGHQGGNFKMFDDGFVNSMQFYLIFMFNHLCSCYWFFKNSVLCGGQNWNFWDKSSRFGIKVVAFTLPKNQPYMWSLCWETAERVVFGTFSKFQNGWVFCTLCFLCIIIGLRQSFCCIIHTWGPSCVWAESYAHRYGQTLAAILYLK